MSRLYSAIVLALMLAAFAPPVLAQDAAHSPEPANIAALVQAAAKEGTLEVAWGDIYGGADGVRRAQDEINKKYHLNLQFKYSPVANGAAFQSSARSAPGKRPAPTCCFTFAIRTWPRWSSRSTIANTCPACRPT
jgi:hypothetical protein